MRLPKPLLWIIGFLKWLFSSKEKRTEMMRSADIVIQTQKRVKEKKSTGNCPPKFWYFRKGYMADRYKKDRKRIYVKQWVNSNMDYFRHIKRKKLI